MDAYKKTTKGKLKLKGIDLKKEKKKKTKKRPAEEDRPDHEVKKQAKPEEKEAKLEKGTGRMLTSASILHGTNTKFMSELAAGATIVIQHPETLESEERMITMVLSDRSASIDAPFTTDYGAAQEFFFKKAPKPSTDGEEEVKVKKVKEVDPSKKRHVLKWREKTENHSYRTRTEVVYGNYTYEELLDMREGKRSDRLCM